MTSSAEDAYVIGVLEQATALRNGKLWEPEPAVRPAAWVNNFEPGERLTAAALLEQFVYFTDPLCDRLLEAAADSLGRTFLVGGRDAAAATAALRAFLSSAVVTRVESEHPNPTDSGNLFCRKARQILLIDEERIVDPGSALAAAAGGSGLVFVDDFVGSGDQMISTWNRPYRTQTPTSFAELHATRPFPCYYLALMATESGAARIARDSPVQLHVAHRLPARYAVDNFTYPPQLSPNIGSDVIALLNKYAPLLDLKSYMKKGNYAAKGYKGLGLAVAMQHSVPDATLPIFWARAGSGWTPLVERK